MSAERATLEAVLERLIPSDEHGAGAREAQVVRYVEPRLGDDERAWLRGLDAVADVPFARLDPDAQDELLRAAEARGDAAFGALLARATEGMFGDPSHGGNAERAGWELLGYPGPSREWTERDQRLGRT